MSHALTQRSDGFVEHAYSTEEGVGWHGLGNELPADSPIEVWTEKAGMQWKIVGAPVNFESSVNGGYQTVPGMRVLYRSDNSYPLGIVSNQYKIMQPSETLEFYRDLVGVGGFKLSAAGTLFGGKKFWATAKIGEEAVIMGQDKIGGYVLLAGSCDGESPTTAMFTSIRAICANTLGFALQEISDGTSRKYLRITHHGVFNPVAVKKELGLAQDSWSKFISDVRRMSEEKISPEKAKEVLVKVFGDTSEKAPSVETQVEKSRVISNIYKLYDEKTTPGADMTSTDGTKWGVMNAVTFYLDHFRKTRTVDSRFYDANIGDGVDKKEKTKELLLAV